MFPSHDHGEEREFIELVRINGVDQYYRVRKWLVAIEGVDGEQYTPYDFIRSDV